MLLLLLLLTMTMTMTMMKGSSAQPRSQAHKLRIEWLESRQPGFKVLNPMFGSSTGVISWMDIL
jgi:hypothetical protein